MSKRFILLLLVASLCLACTNAFAGDTNNKDRLLPVMTRNLDAGTDFGFVFAALQNPDAQPADLINAVSLTLQEIAGSQIDARAQGIAREIKQTQPYLIGLQEITTLRVTPAGSPATITVADALGSLMNALKAQGLQYEILKAQVVTDILVPAFDGQNFLTVEFVDADAILVRTDLPVSQLKINNVQFELFKTNVPDLNLAGIPVHFGRGWIAVDAQLRGKPFRFVTTHLESLSDLVQAGQTFELIDGPLNTTLPVILAGDLNSGPFLPPAVSPVGPAFGILLGSGGFIDTWGFLHSSEPGFTWPLFLEDPPRASTASQRIDNILIRGDGIEPFSEILTGTSPFTPGLWASDHAGAVATVKLLPKQ